MLAWDRLPHGGYRRDNQSLEDALRQGYADYEALMYRVHYVNGVLRYASGVAKEHPAAGAPPPWCPSLEVPDGRGSDLSITDGLGWPLAMVAGGIRYSVVGEAWQMPSVDIWGARFAYDEVEWSGYPPVQTPAPWCVSLIPYRPVWAGLVVDICFWSGASALAPWCNRRVRGQIRHWKGKCRHCGYSLTEGRLDRCPECGMNR